MRKFLILPFLLCFFFVAKAKHVTGGEVTYTYLGQGATPGTAMYRITLMLFRDENAVGAAPMPASVAVGIFNTATGVSVQSNRSISVSSIENVPLAPLPNCITNPPSLSYTVGYYTFSVTLPVNAAGYTIAYQTCCRIDGISNTPNSTGATYATQIPGSNTVGVNADDNSAAFAKSISVICYNRPFTLDFSAFDTDNDSLVYRFCGAYDGGAATDASYSTPAGPPYSTISYIGGFTGSSPLGAQAFINPQTGIISGIAPQAGRYVVSVCVDSYDRTTRQYRATHRKDFIVTVAPCDLAGAQLNPSYISCDGFTFNFTNLNNSPLNQTYFWDFGDGNSSTDQNPTHTYTTAGVYTLKLVVNRGDQCGDSTTAQLRVFPGYFPAFNNMSPVCANVPVQFTDATTANYGIANNWKWDFGVNSLFNDTSRLQNPIYAYTTPGTYTVSLIVSSSVGCVDTLEHQIEVLDKAPYTLTNDTLICNIDTLQLNFTTLNAGTFNWTPNYMINNTGIANPSVSPDVSTTYYISYADNFGCTAFDSVRVNVVDRVALSVMADTTVCLTDSLILRTNSDGLSFTWTPAATLNNATFKSPTAVPTLPLTNYHVIARIGNCFSQEDVVVRTVPYPAANAGVDTTICFGDSYQLTGSGGSIYNWTPRIFLTNSNISNPLAQNPLQDVQYILEVRDVLGCPKPAYDTMLLHVAKIVADAGPADTNVVLGQPVQLVATGSVHYVWSPVTWLNNPTIFNPVSLPQESIQYVVRASNDQGCFDTDTINVKVFKIDPDLLVPTAFSPDNDGLNDVFRPIVIGMKSLDKFRVYNRWGQLMFSTTQTNGHGWDGSFKGAAQATGTYVWEAEGVTYLGKKIKRKGTVILIR
ncbi:MAG TPA: PKD domain-containing protein [Ferruginibacter sp.]|nr:PKD domain-containing protein [Ferruginibacter sp.]HRE64898.1 PKD domain-containing protein [Ferruginibacter sp.]